MIDKPIIRNTSPSPRLYVNTSISMEKRATFTAKCRIDRVSRVTAWVDPVSFSAIQNCPATIRTCVTKSEKKKHWKEKERRGKESGLKKKNVKTRGRGRMAKEEEEEWNGEERYRAADPFAGAWPPHEYVHFERPSTLSASLRVTRISSQIRR